MGETEGRKECEKCTYGLKVFLYVEWLAATSGTEKTFCQTSNSPFLRVEGVCKQGMAFPGDSQQHLPFPGSDFKDYLNMYRVLYAI